MSIKPSIDTAVFDNRKTNVGRIARKNGSRKLYLDFHYHGVRIEKSTGLDDNPQNRRKAQMLLDEILRMKQEGTLEFGRIFPNASEEEIAFHTRLEKGEYTPNPKGITFGAYVRNQWYPTIWMNFDEKKKGADFKSVIDFHLLPYFGDMTFFQMTGTELQRFLASLKHQKGPKAGQPLARSTKVNILQILKTIWEDAVVEYRWLLPDPFLGLKKHLKKEKRKRVEVFRFSEWMAIMDATDPYYRPLVQFMVLTGLISSEISALRPENIRGGYLYVESSMVRGEESDELKTTYRERRIPITEALETLLGKLPAPAPGDLLFKMADGSPVNPVRFRNRVWKPALEKAGVKYRKPYCARHSFAAWALTVGIDPNRLVHLMGHASKQMVFEVYGRYTEGLEADKEQILSYFGKDFLNGK